MSLAAFLRDDARWLAAGALLAFASSFGQTFFIAAFAGAWRAEFGLSHGQWGAIYMAATVTSAAVLTQAGRLADHVPTRRLAFFILCGFASVALAVSAASAWWMLLPLVFGLRFCGQGMLSHVAIVSMGKWFRARRARAVAVAALGFSVGEAVLPAAALAALGAFGWRAAWLAVAGVLLLVIAPAFLAILRRERIPVSAPGDAPIPDGMGGRSWTRAEMLRHWLFWAILPGVAGPPWVGTVVFFQTVHLTEIKGWDPVAYAGLAFPAFSAVSIATSFVAGWAADRWGAVRLLPVYLLGWAAGAVALSLAESLSGAVLAFALAGIGTGAVSVVHGAIFAELYGPRWLGGVKAVAFAVAVLASALGPGLSGAMLDGGIGFEAQLIGMGAFLALTSLWLLPVSRRARQELAA